MDSVLNNLLILFNKNYIGQRKTHLRLNRD